MDLAGLLTRLLGSTSPSPADGWAELRQAPVQTRSATGSARTIGFPGGLPLRDVFAFDGSYSDSGAYVSSSTALTIAAVWRCVSILAGLVASLPVRYMARTSTGHGELVLGDPVGRLVSVAPNDEMTSPCWRESGMLSLLLRGNTYSRIETTYGGRPTALVLLNSDCVIPERAGGRLRYRVAWEDRTGAGSETLAPEEVLHVPGLSFNGIYGISPITLMRQSVGVAMTLERTAAELFVKGIRGSGAIQLDEELGDEAYTRLLSSIQRELAGNLHAPILLEGGAKWVPLSISPDDAQFLASREFAVSDIGRWFGIPDHLLNSTNKTTSFGAGLEAMNRGMLTYTLQVWIAKWEAELNRKLAPGDDMYFSFDLGHLLRPDMAAQYSALTGAISGGLLTANQARQVIDQPPHPDGDVLYAPRGATPATDTDEAGESSAVEAAEQDAGDVEMGTDGEDAGEGEQE